MLSILHVLLCPAILRTTVISIVSRICLIFEVAGLISAVYVIMELIVVLLILDSNILLRHLVLFRDSAVVAVFMACALAFFS